MIPRKDQDWCIGDRNSDIARVVMRMKQRREFCSVWGWNEHLFRSKERGF